METYSGGGVSATSNGAEVHGDFWLVRGEDDVN